LDGSRGARYVRHGPVQSGAGHDVLGRSSSRFRRISSKC
jgi:hypothetical protein